MIIMDGKQRSVNVLTEYALVRLREKPALLETLAAWFSEKWRVPLEAYRESMAESLGTPAAWPRWYAAVFEGRIIGGLGLIENDFHERKDLKPNVCAVYTEPEFRGRGVAGALLQAVYDDAKAAGVSPLYLLTDHTGFYERYGWEYLCPVRSDGEETPSRMYIKR